MKSSFLSLALCAAFLATIGAPAARAATSSGITRAPNAVELAWLAANHLDPKDPNLKAKIAALITAQSNAAHQRHLAIVADHAVTTLPLEHAGRIVALDTMLNSIVPYRNVGNPLPGAPRIDNVVVNNVWYGKPSNKEPDRPGPIVVVGIPEIGEGDTVAIEGAWLAGATIELTFGNCGSLHPAVNARWGGLQLGMSIPKLPVDERRKAGTLTVHTSGGTASTPVIFVATLLEVHASVSVGVYPNNADNGHAFNITSLLGFVEGKTMETQDGDPTRQSLNPGWAGGSGDSGVDTFGDGIKLQHGWTATATAIVPNICTGEVCGGHAIIIQAPGMFSPTSFQTKVAWSYDPLNWSSYIVNYKLRGPNGGVALSTMPQQSSCNLVTY